MVAGEVAVVRIDVYGAGFGAGDRERSGLAWVLVRSSYGVVRAGCFTGGN